MLFIFEAKCVINLSDIECKCAIIQHHSRMPYAVDVVEGGFPTLGKVASPVC